MTNHDLQISKAIAKRTLATTNIVSGIPGVCMAALVGPDCVEVAQWFQGEHGPSQNPFVYCLN